ncbi:MAG: hypothetical protein QM756_39995 [Polyangiaceae bacterium]
MLSASAAVRWVAAIATSACTLTSGAALADSLLDRIDPWAARGGPPSAPRKPYFTRQETLDPWREGEPVRPEKAWIQVNSGLDLTPEQKAQRWVHPDIVDPWAKPSSAAFPVR